MGDDELEPRYVRQRAELKALVRREARAKSSLGAALGAAGADSGCMTGPALATLVEPPARALNEGDFPSAGNGGFVQSRRDGASRGVVRRRVGRGGDYPRRRRR